MKEKIYDFALDHVLSPSIKKKIDKFLTANAEKSVWPASFHWDEEDDQLLHISTYPVKWEIVFTPRKAVVYGNGPMWARLLFTEKKRILLQQGMQQVLQEVGLIETKSKKSPAAKPAKKIAAKKG